MPKAPKCARLLLKKGKARPHWNKPGIFCIILKYDVQPDNQQLHRFQPEKGGIRKPYGGSMGLVRHIKYGLTYIGGTGKRVTQNARVEDCTILTRIAWRTQRYAGTGRRHPSPHLLVGVSCL